LVRTAHDQPLVLRDPTIGFLNLLGDEGVPLLAADKAALSPLFAKRLVSARATPRCEVLFVYSKIEPTGPERPGPT
jgi:hypothetical protein